MVHWHRRLGAGLLSVVVVGAIAWGFRPRPVAVDVAEASFGGLQVTVDEEGRTRVTDRFVGVQPKMKLQEALDAAKA